MSVFPSEYRDYSGYAKYERSTFNVQPPLTMGFQLSFVGVYGLAGIVAVIVVMVRLPPSKLGLCSS